MHWCRAAAKGNSTEGSAGELQVATRFLKERSGATGDAPLLRISGVREALRLRTNRGRFVLGVLQERLSISFVPARHPFGVENLTKLGRCQRRRNRPPGLKEHRFCEQGAVAVAGRRRRRRSRQFLSRRWCDPSDLIRHQDALAPVETRSADAGNRGEREGRLNRQGVSLADDPRRQRPCAAGDVLLGCGFARLECRRREAALRPTAFPHLTIRAERVAQGHAVGCH